MTVTSAHFEAVEKIADAVLYEGYMLYPYRPTAIKNRQRWNFGTLYPHVYAEAQRPAESFRLVTECLVESNGQPTLDIRIRFLQLAPAQARAASATGNAQHLSPNTTDSWQEGVERSADVSGIAIADLLAQPRAFSPQFEIPRRPVEQAAPTLPQMRDDLDGLLTVRSADTASGAQRLHIELQNNTRLENAGGCSRNDALPLAFTSAHLILSVSGGSFVSLLDAPAKYREAAAACQNTGCFPVLAGDESSQTTMLCSPIILYDYPKIAPESAGDFFDGTEMDEMLALRVLTLTEAEKQEMRSGDARSRMILERTESLPDEHLMKLHGAIRGLRPMQQEKP